MLRDVGQDDVAHERVGEAPAPGDRLVLRCDAGREGFVDERVDAVARHGGGRGQEVHVEVGPDDRAVHEQVADGRGEAVETGREQVEHDLGNADVLGAAAAPPPRVLVGVPLRAQVLEQFGHEERVAGGVGVERSRDRRLRSAEPVGDDPGDVVRGEATQRDAGHPHLAGDVGDDPAQHGVVEVGFGAVTEHDEESLFRVRAQDVAQDVEGVAVGVLDVVEQDQRGRVPGRPLDHAGEGVEEVAASVERSGGATGSSGSSAASSEASRPLPATKSSVPIAAA